MQTAEEENAHAKARVAEYLEDAQKEAKEASDDEDREYWSNQVAEYQRLQEGLDLAAEMQDVIKSEERPFDWKDHQDLGEHIDGESPSSQDWILLWASFKATWCS